MSKRLILLLAFAFVVGITAAAYAEVQNVKVSGDLTVYGIMRELGVQNNVTPGATNDDKAQSLASIVRLRVDADLTDNVTATVRLINERYWGAEYSDNNYYDSNSTIHLDLAYATLKEFLYSPLTLTIGRQELHFGNDMIVGDYDTNNVAQNTPFGSSGNDADLSARKAFDAIRATLNYDPLVVDIISAKVRERTINRDDDTSLYGVNANYALNKTTTVEGYWFAKHEARKQFSNVKKPRRVDTVGARIATQPIENLTYQLEAAYQFGRYHADASADATRPTVERKAWALETALNYDFKNVKYTPSALLGYAYFSGDAYNHTTNAGHYRAWDPMYENQKFGDIANAQFNQTNAHIVSAMASMKPWEDVTLKGEYYLFWWAKAYPDGQLISTVRGNAANMTDKRFAGQELDLKAIYDYTEDVQFGLLVGLFFPGTAFSKGDTSITYSRNTASEVIGSMKVTF